MVHLHRSHLLLHLPIHRQRGDAMLVQDASQAVRVGNVRAESDAPARKRQRFRHMNYVKCNRVFRGCAQ